MTAAPQTDAPVPERGSCRRQQTGLPVRMSVQMLKWSIFAFLLLTWFSTEIHRWSCGQNWPAERAGKLRHQRTQLRPTIPRHQQGKASESRLSVAVPAHHSALCIAGVSIEDCTVRGSVAGRLLHPERSIAQALFARIVFAMRF